VFLKTNFNLTPIKYITTYQKDKRKSLLLQEFPSAIIEKTLVMCYNKYMSFKFVQRHLEMGVALVNTYENGIDEFIYKICYKPMWATAYAYINQHPYSLDLTYSKIKYPDNTILEDMMLELTSNIRVDEDKLTFDSIVSCTVGLTADSYYGTSSNDINQWLRLSCGAIVTEKLDLLEVTNIVPYQSGIKKSMSGQMVSKNIGPILIFKCGKEKIDVKCGTILIDAYTY